VSSAPPRGRRTGYGPLPAFGSPGRQILSDSKRKTFEVTAMGRVLRSSREFRTPVELFLAGVADWEPHIVYLLLAA
jgi:hypothetical protein